MKQQTIEIIYQAEEKILDKKIKDKIKNINTKEIIEKSDNQKELIKMLEDIEENYNIKIGEYIKEFYKQGFIDGINLMLNCLK